jgi:hypothetical protein
MSLEKRISEYTLQVEGLQYLELRNYPHMNNVDVKRLLTRLGVDKQKLTDTGPYTCPLHPNSKRKHLWASCTPNTGVYFRCSAPRCNFVGSAVELVQAVRKITVEEAMELFRPGEELHDTLSYTGNASFQEDMYQTSLLDIRLQGEALTYLKECQRGISQKGFHMATRLQMYGLSPRAVSESDCGMLMPQIPDSLKALRNLNSNRDYLIFPYFSGNLLTCLGVFDPIENSTEYHNIDGDTQYGIFMEKKLSWPAVDSITVCADEVDALILFGKSYNAAKMKPNPVAVRSPEALAAIPRLNQLNLLCHPDKPLTIHDVANYRNALKKVDGLQVGVIDLSTPLRKTRSTRLKHRLDKPTPVWEWVAERAEVMYAEGRDKFMAEMVTAPISEKDRDSVLAILEESDADPNLITDMQHIVCTTLDRMLGDVRVRRTPNGYRKVEPENRPISNFSIYVDYYTDGGKEGKIVVGSIKIEGDHKLYPFRLPANVFMLSGKRIAAAVWDVLIERGCASIPIAHDLPGVDWFTLARVFDEAPFIKSVTSLGLDKDGDLNFTHFSLNTETYGLSEVETTVGILDKVLNHYSQIECGRDYNLDCFKELLESSNPAKLAVAGVFGHILHQLAASIQVRDLPAKHLCFSSVVGGNSVWESVFKQSMRLFSGSSGAPTLPNLPGHFLAFDRDYRLLGNLPIFCRMQSPNKYAAGWLQTVHGPAICLADSEMAASISREDCTSFVKDDISLFGDIEAELLTDREIAEVRSAWPYLLQVVLPAMSMTERQMHSNLPSVLGYRKLCKHFDVKPNPAVAGLFSEYLEIPDTNTVDAFLLSVCMVHYGNNHLRIADVKSQAYYQDNTHTVLGYFGEGQVHLLAGRAVAAANEYGLSCSFNKNHLNEQFKERGINWRHERRYLVWSIDERLWDKYAERYRPNQLTLLPASQKVG